MMKSELPGKQLTLELCTISSTLKLGAFLCPSLTCMISLFSFEVKKRKKKIEEEKKKKEEEEEKKKEKEKQQH